MATGSENYLSLVRQAFQGDLKLPAFQRDFKWNRKQVIRLYDSLRLSYPVGSIIVLEGTKQELKERAFRGASSGAEGRETKRLVLDGQQRLTAGIDLFYGESEESPAQYFIDIDKIAQLVADKGVDLDSEDSIGAFLMELEDDDGYCVARTRVENPYHLLNSRHLLSTVLLRPDNSKSRDLHLEEYEKQFPIHKPIIRNVIKPYLVINEAPSIPEVIIDSSLQLESISRIFSTLNSTGKVLTPFELVVAVLYSHNIDLREDLELLREVYPLLKNMDSTGEICLQTVAMLVGENHKKSLLPKNLKAKVWKNNQEEAADLLSEVGKFLTETFGMALDLTNQLIPYDSIFVPMAAVFKRVGYATLGASVRAGVNKKLIQWVIGSALSQRYQEGVHNKQIKDANEITRWINEDSDDYKPAWLGDVAVPSLRLVGTKGAIANLLRCLINQETLKDPLTSEPVNYGRSKTQSHHIFPTKFVEKMPGWDPKIGDNADLFLNLMQLSSSTNARFLNDDPSMQIIDALKTHSEDVVAEIYSRHMVSGDALAILRKAHKTKEDYRNFIKLRETMFEKKLSGLGFTKVSGLEAFDEMASA